jgi:gamma-glutamyltranspeptidase/glutathione hydrolase
MTLPLVPFAARTGCRGMVTAADHLAASAGLDMLTHGGSAADAAVAAAAVMATTSPHLCGLGGDLLAMVSAPGHAPEALLAVGRAGSGVDAARLRAQGHRTMPVRGDLHTVPVPGAVDGWLALLARYGRLPADVVFAPAIELAEAGFVPSIMLTLASHLVHDLPGAQELCPDGPLDLQHVVRLPGIGRTLRAIARDGRDGFYGGEFGRGLRTLGDGLYDESDLNRGAADWCTPVTRRVWEHDLWTVPPPSQGYLTLASAWMAAQAGIPNDPTGPAWPHLIIEASRAAGLDRPAVLFDGADGAALVDLARLERAGSRLELDQAAPPDVTRARRGPEASLPRLGDGDTTHLCAVDADGLGISLTQSNALDFGSHLIEPSTGIFLHNRGIGFSLEPGHPAELGPGRRPPHTLSPLLATRPDGTLSHLVGAMGGDGQPQILLQLLARMLHGGHDPAAAVAAPRLTLDAPAAGPFRLWWGDDLTVMLEANAPEGWRHGLETRGHRVQLLRPFDPTAVGCAQIITVEAGQYAGAADPRSPEGGTASR